MPLLLLLFHTKAAVFYTIKLDTTTDRQAMNRDSKQANTDAFCVAKQARSEKFHIRLIFHSFKKARLLTPRRSSSQIELTSSLHHFQDCASRPCLRSLSFLLCPWRRRRQRLRAQASTGTTFNLPDFQGPTLELEREFDSLASEL